MASSVGVNRVLITGDQYVLDDPDYLAQYIAKQMKDTGVCVIRHNRNFNVIKKGFDANQRFEIIKYKYKTHSENVKNISMIINPEKKTYNLQETENVIEDFDKKCRKHFRDLNDKLDQQRISEDEYCDLAVDTWVKKAKSIKTCCAFINGGTVDLMDKDGKVVYDMTHFLGHTGILGMLQEKLKLSYPGTQGQVIHSAS